MKIPNINLFDEGVPISLARIVSEDSQQRLSVSIARAKSSKDS